MGDFICACIFLFPKFLPFDHIILHLEKRLFKIVLIRFKITIFNYILAIVPVKILGSELAESSLEPFLWGLHSHPPDLLVQ